MTGVTIETYPLTMERWDDLPALFGSKSACGGCYCMYFRIPRRECMRQFGDGNREALKWIVASGKVPGLIGYVAGKPVGWVGVGAREDFPVLQRSRVCKPVDALPVWSMVCFLMAYQYRHRGWVQGLIEGAIEFARSRGAETIEGYPVDTFGKKVNSLFIFTGTMHSFLKAGFVEVARRSPKRPIMRYYLGERGQQHGLEQ